MGGVLIGAFTLTCIGLWGSASTEDDFAGTPQSTQSSAAPSAPAAAAAERKATKVSKKKAHPLVGSLVHVTGCDAGELVVPIVNLWSKPGGIAVGGDVAGKLSGDGRPDQGLRCQGAVVLVTDARKVEGRRFFEVDTLVGSQSGWITDSFIGRRFTKGCAFFDGEAEARRKCQQYSGNR